VNRKSFARTSSEPGKTQTINFYNVNNELYLVDLPGYGYARTSMETREKWGKMIEKYLHTSKMLKAVFLLVDIRHEPSQNDVNMYDWIKYQGFTPVVIATKADKIKRSQLPRQIKLVRDTLGMEKEEILIPFSAETKQGREEIWKVIEGES
jgi:GTP-binding protein